MTFGAITAVYLPVSANAGASLYGSNVRSLLSAPDATADASSVTSHGNGGDTLRTVSAYAQSSADSIQEDYGWAIPASDMGSTDTEKRRQKAGDHSCTLRLSHSSTLGDSSAELHFYAYRVGPAPDRARTLIGSVIEPISLNALGAQVTYTASIAIPEIVYEADESLQYSFEIRATGQALTGANTIFRTGTSGGVAVRVDFPRLDTIVEITGTAQGGSTAIAKVANIKAAVGESHGISTAQGVVGGIAAAVGTAQGTSVAVASVGGIAGSVGTSQASSEAIAKVAVVKGTVGTSNVGGGDVIYNRPVYIFSD